MGHDPVRAADFDEVGEQPELGRRQPHLVASKSRPVVVEVHDEVAMIPLLIGLGVKELSVAPSSVVAVRAQARTLDLAACEELAAPGDGGR